MLHVNVAGLELIKTVVYIDRIDDVTHYRGQRYVYLQWLGIEPPVMHMNPYEQGGQAAEFPLLNRVSLPGRSRAEHELGDSTKRNSYSRGSAMTPSLSDLLAWAFRIKCGETFQRWP